MKACTGSASTVGCVTRMPTPYCLVMPSRREPRFTASPITVYDMRNSEPMLPTLMRPVLTPTPILTSGQPRAANSRFSCGSAACMSSAVCTARVAWSFKSTGAFQNAMMASPMYLSMVPRCCCTMRVMVDR